MSPRLLATLAAGLLVTVVAVVGGLLYTFNRINELEGDAVTIREQVVDLEAANADLTDKLAEAEADLRFVDSDIADHDDAIQDLVDETARLDDGLAWEDCQSFTDIEEFASRLDYFIDEITYDTYLSYHNDLVELSDACRAALRAGDDPIESIGDYFDMLDSRPRRR